ncbi:uncharacterized protein BKCO1_3000031 [Diplodia corticola]|uniref:Rrn7/TAF1B C-terminal cyclin domain-containing protein n=1 Tax=Diplodia corticola TaxID=236234 RepID=A0A1J9QZQ0_9PEZI|nr:uncharacterized protein BKCO1_3000031 [Diplodia corticola]OJD33466.1 hypothetical protein BKCO1_3000031 [Diplodia corticola]
MPGSRTTMRGTLSAKEPRSGSRRKTRTSKKAPTSKAKPRSSATSNACNGSSAHKPAGWSTPKACPPTLRQVNLHHPRRRTNPHLFSQIVIRDLWHIRLRALSWTQNRDNAPHPIRPLDTLVLCYFGLVVLQLPVSLHDLHSWLSFSSSSTTTITNPPAPQNNNNNTTTTPTTLTDPTPSFTPSSNSPHPTPPSLLLLPSPLTHRLPPAYLSALSSAPPSPPFPPTPSRLQSGICALARLFRADLGVALPPLNFFPLAYRAYVEALGLPLELLPVVERLARGAGVGWVVGGGDAFGGDEGGGERRRRMKVDARCWLPEAQLAALVVVGMEVLCPLREEPEGAGEGDRVKKKVPAFEWAEWVRRRERGAVDEARGEAMALVRVGGGVDGAADGGDDDEYLSAAEKMLQGRDVDDVAGLPKATALLGGGADEAAYAEEDEDELEGLEGIERVFYEAVAERAVMPVSLLVKSVGLIEKKLEESAKKIREGRRRLGNAR